MDRLLLLCSLSLLLVACGGDDTSEASTNAASTSTSGDSQDTGTTTSTTSNDTNADDPSCFPMGLYGPCSTNMGCQCVIGGDIYQFCTSYCDDVSQCGDPADFPGATPTCKPVNAGSPQNICNLQCTTTADCPCGLECEPTYLICVERL